MDIYNKIENSILITNEFRTQQYDSSNQEYSIHRVHVEYWHKQISSRILIQNI